MNTQKLEQVPIDKLVPYARNARTHSKEQIAQLRASLREFGFVSPAVIDADYNINFIDITPRFLPVFAEKFSSEYLRKSHKIPLFSNKLVTPGYTRIRSSL